MLVERMNNGELRPGKAAMPLCPVLLPPLPPLDLPTSPDACPSRGHIAQGEASKLIEEARLKMKAAAEKAAAQNAGDATLTAN